MSYLISPQANLVLQIIAFAIVLVSLVLKMKRRYFLHGTSMLTVVVLNVISFLLIMGPSLRDSRTFIINNLSDRFALVTVGHVVFGTIAGILAIWVVIAWHLQSTTKNCVRKKKMMRFIFLLWTAALIFGFLLHLLQNTQLFV